MVYCSLEYLRLQVELLSQIQTVDLAGFIADDHTLYLSLLEQVRNVPTVKSTMKLWVQVMLPIYIYKKRARKNMWLKNNTTINNQQKKILYPALLGFPVSLILGHSPSTDRFFSFFFFYFLRLCVGERRGSGAFILKA